MGTGVGVGVAVGIDVGVGVGIGVGVRVAVGTGVSVAVGTGVGVGSGVHVGAGVQVGSGVQVCARVGVGTGVGAKVGAGVDVGIAVSIGRSVGAAEVHPAITIQAISPTSATGFIIVLPSPCFPLLLSFQGWLLVKDKASHTHSPGILAERPQHSSMPKSWIAGYAADIVIPSQCLTPSANNT